MYPRKFFHRKSTAKPFSLDLKDESYFGLNQVGTRVWQLLQDSPTVEETFDTLSDEYDVRREQLASDVGELLARLVEAGLVLRVN